MKKFLSTVLIAVIVVSTTACSYGASKGSKIQKLKDFIFSKHSVEQTEPKATKEELSFTDYYAVTGEAEFTLDIPEVGKVRYTGLDKLGRPTGVIANLDYSLVDRERKQKREPITIDPPGFTNNKKVVITEKDGRRYKGYFYNRSHLLADSLGGSATKENLVTGTRTQNVGIKNKGGMAYTEEKARQFFKNPTNATLVYEVIPQYKGSEIVPRTVVVNIKSSDGTINERVVVDNSATGYAVDYLTGDWRAL